MTGKKVRVYWPVDQQWYIATVERYDPNVGEHLLRYPDGDTEWVCISEDHTTNAQYRPADHNGGLRRLPSLGGGVSFALSQSFGLPAAQSMGGPEDEKTMPLKSGHSHQQARLFQQLNLDRTESSMSSFGMYRQPSFGGGSGQQRGHHHQHQQSGGGSHQPFQILSPNSFAHSFASKSMDYGPPPLNHYPQQREEDRRSDMNSASPGARDSAPPAWPSDQYSDPNSFYDHGSGAPPPPHQPQQRMMLHAYPGNPPPYDAKHGPDKLHRPSVLSSSPKSTGTKARVDKKALAKAWTKAEDEHLLDLVLEMSHPLKWSIIAQSLSEYVAARNAGTPERTGKQCRERYVNHLNPRLKHTDFTPQEDATIWRMYATIGTQWAKMSKVIPGRTDNNLKNRFHNLKRQLQREEDSRKRQAVPDGYDNMVRVDRIRDVPAPLRTRIEDMWNHRRNIGLCAADSYAPDAPAGDGSRERDAANKKDGGTKAEEKDGQAEGSSASSSTAVAAEAAKRYRKFGPFEPVAEPSQCGRCGLFLPSVQCGNEICTKTGWCKVCTKVSMHLGGSVLRECLNLRKGQSC